MGLKGMSPLKRKKIDATMFLIQKIKPYGDIIIILSIKPEGKHEA